MFFLLMAHGPWFKGIPRRPHTLHWFMGLNWSCGSNCLRGHTHTHTHTHMHIQTHACTHKHTHGHTFSRDEGLDPESSFVSHVLILCLCFFTILSISLSLSVSLFPSPTQTFTYVALIRTFGSSCGFGSKDMSQIGRASCRGRV